MKIRKFFDSLSVFILVSIITSQCFAQSPAASQKKEEIENRKYLEVINSLYYYIQQNYVDDVDPQLLYEGAIKGMLQALDDPYSAYMGKSDWRSLTDTTVGSFGGVGLSITKPAQSTKEKPAYVRVAAPIDNSPGARAGIQSGDFIVKIDGVDTSTISMEEVLGMLRGTVGESVTVRIRRSTVEFDKTLVRAVIENPTVKYGMINSTGYILLTEFSTATADRVQEAIDSFKKAGYTGLIIDLRNNGGGLLSSAVDIADKFIDEGVIVSTKSRIEYENAIFYAEKKDTVVRNIPVVVLVNESSASASEILAGALKDSKKAYLVGTKTYGKGSVQVPTSLINNDGFKITVAKYYSPSDVNIDKVGILPDEEVKSPEFTKEEEEAFKKLLESSEIEKYVAAHPKMTEQEIVSYAKQLKSKYNLEDRILRKLVRNESELSMQPSRLYDLDYDLQLKRALEIVKSPVFDKLIKNSKTLKQQSEENSVKK